LRDLRGASDLLVAVAAVLKVGHRRVSVLVGGAADDPRLGIGMNHCVLSAGVREIDRS
jgi:hypothetical protein